MGGDTVTDFIGDGLELSSGSIIFDCSDVAGTGLTCSGEDLTVTDLTCTDCLNATEIEDIYLLNSGDVGTGVFDFSGATLQIPSGSNSTIDDVGDCAIDTTDSQLICGTWPMSLPFTEKPTLKSGALRSLLPRQRSYQPGSLKVPTELDGYTITAIRCSVDAGTSKTIAVEDEGTNSGEDIACGTSVTSDDGTITNATITAGEEVYVDFGATSGSVNYVTITVFGRWTRE